MNATVPPKKETGGFRIKRVYAPATADDGLRVLVDRLWPRGIAKEKARIDLWLKDIAPSEALRHRFHGEPSKWQEFVAAYDAELKREPASTAVASLREHLRRQIGDAPLRGARRDPQQCGGAEGLAGAVELTVSARLPLGPQLPTYRCLARSDAKGHEHHFATQQKTTSRSPRGARVRRLRRRSCQVQIVGP